MSRTLNIQTDFTAGVIDPKLRGRLDLDQYYKAMSSAQNIVVQPQGGITRRPGLQYISTISAGAPASGVRLVPFEFSTTDSYMLLFVNERMHIFKAKTLQTNINGFGNDYLVTTGITSARLANLRWVQSADTLIVVEDDMHPKKIVRGVDDSSWTVTDLAYDEIPKHAFTVTAISPAGTLTPSAIDGNVTLTASAATFHEGRSGTAQAGASATITLDSGAVATNDIYNGSTIRINGGTGDGQNRIISDYVGASKVATVSVAWTTTPDNTSTFTIESHVGQYVNNKVNFGRARIVEYTSATVVKAYTETPFFDKSAVATGDWEIEHGYEDAWSDDRGWPRTATFHEGRLYHGGSKSLPSTVWGSRVNEFFNFEIGEGLADEKVEATIDTNQLNAVVDIFSGRDLQIMTTGGEFYVPQTTLEPITPSNFVVRLASRNGTKAGVGVQGLDSGTLYIQRQGRSLNEFVYTEAQQAYVSAQVSVLSSHLLKSPTRLALRRSTSTDEGDQLLIVNSADGTMAAYTLLRSQNVVAASEFITDGEFTDVGVDIDTIYTVVKRSINGADVYFLEAFNKDFTTDSAVQGGVASSVSGSHLVAEAAAKLILDGNVQLDQTLNASGNLTFPRASTSSYELGLNYTVAVSTMPVDPRQKGGTRQGMKRRIVRIDVICDSTQSLTINESEISFREFDQTPLDSAVAEFTGIKTLHGIQGFSQDAKVSFGQNTPLKFTVLGLEYRVSAGG